MLSPRSTNLFFAFVLVLGLVLGAGGESQAAIDCFMCHDRGAFNKGVNHEPASKGDCFSCHNPHVAKFEGLIQERVKDLCYSCHVNAADEQSRGFVHQPVQEGECLGCHDPHAADQAGLLKDKPSKICFDCHSDLPRKFKYTHAPFGKGQCSSCHLPHQSSDPYLLVKEADSLCLGCHQTSLQSKHAGFPADLKNCRSCHNPHGSDRPGLIRTVLHQPYTEGCQNCHSERGKPVTIDTCLGCHPEVGGEMASSHNHLVRYGENGCVACHSPHAGDDDRLLRGKERHVCGTCHEATFRRLATAKYAHPMEDACSDCHAPHGSNHPAMTKAPINDVCSACHDEHGVFTHPIGEKVLDPRTGQMMTCISCHASKGSDYAFHTRFRASKDLCVQCHAEY